MENSKKVQTLVMGAILTSVVILLQLLGSFVRLGPFSISLVLIPIVIGGATAGVGIAAWLGFIFGLTVMLSGDAAAFLAINFWGTWITVLLKGTLCGFFAALVYRLFKEKNQYLAIILSAIVCPIVNTGVFLLGCRVFFYDTIIAWASGTNVLVYMLVGLVGGNFIAEMLINIILSPTVLRILKLRKQ